MENFFIGLSALFVVISIIAVHRASRLPNKAVKKNKIINLNKGSIMGYELEIRITSIRELKAYVWSRSSFDTKIMASKSFNRSFYLPVNEQLCEKAKKWGDAQIETLNRISRFIKVGKQ